MNESLSLSEEVFDLRSIFSSYYTRMHFLRKSSCERTTRLIERERERERDRERERERDCLNVFFTWYGACTVKVVVSFLCFDVNATIIIQQQCYAITRDQKDHSHLLLLPPPCFCGFQVFSQVLEDIYCVIREGTMQGTRKSTVH